MPPSSLPGIQRSLNNQIITLIEKRVKINMIILTDAEKAFDKIQYLWMVKRKKKLLAN